MLMIYKNNNTFFIMHTRKNILRFRCSYLRNGVLGNRQEGLPNINASVH